MINKFKKIECLQVSDVENNIEWQLILWKWKVSEMGKVVQTKVKARYKFHSFIGVTE